jgi:hypothetical protein
MPEYKVDLKFVHSFNATVPAESEDEAMKRVVQIAEEMGIRGEVTKATVTDLDSGSQMVLSFLASGTFITKK